MVSLPIRQDLSAADLRDLARKESDARVSRRLLALAMALDGISRGEAARQAGMDRQALRDWGVRVQCRGRQWPAGSGAFRPALLAPELEEELRHLIEAGADFERDGVIEYRVKHIRALALRHFGADYSRSGMQGRLHRMKLSYLKPRPIHPKTDPATQEAFKKKLRRDDRGN